MHLVKIESFGVDDVVGVFNQSRKLQGNKSETDETEESCDMASIRGSRVAQSSD